MMWKQLVAALTVLLLSLAGASVQAQDDAATERELERYRKMLKDDPWSNPGLLDADKGEAIWKEKRGPKDVSLEACDLGRGPGVVEGAFAELPPDRLGLCAPLLAFLVDAIDF